MFASSATTTSVTTIARVARLTALMVIAALALSPTALAGPGQYSKNLSVGDGNSGSPNINEWGTHVAFVSTARNLDPRHPGTPQIVVQEISSGRTWLASIAADGTPAADPLASVAIADPFASSAPPAVPPTQLVSGPAMGGRGPSVAFASTASNLVGGDSNGVSDVFIHDRIPGRTELVSVSASGGPADGPSWGAAYGYGRRWVAFISAADNLVRGDTNGQPDAFVRDMVKRKTILVSQSSSCGQGNGPALDVSIRDARWVAFSSEASNLVRGDRNRVADVFLHELNPLAYKAKKKRCKKTLLASTSTSGRKGNGPSRNVSIGGYGKFVAWESTATNLVPGDTNGVQDVFWKIMVDRTKFFGGRSYRAPRTLRASVQHQTGRQLNGPSANAEMTVAGRFVYFDSTATNVHPNDSDVLPDIFHIDLKFDNVTLTSIRNGKPCDGNPENQCSPPTPLHGVHPSVSYHGTDVVFTSDARVVREETPPVGQPGVFDILMRYLGPMSAPPPREV